MNAKECLAFIATQAETLTPPARGAAIAASLRQVGEIGGALPLDIIDAHAGFSLLSKPRPEDAGDNSEKIAARRKTCGDIALICEGIAGPDHGDPRKLAAVFECVVAQFAGSTDPRQDAMAWTASREFNELTG